MADVWADWSSTAAGNAPVGTDTPDDLHVQLQNIKAQVKGNCIDTNLAVAENDFLVASGSGVFVKKTLAETQTLLALTPGYFSRLVVKNNAATPNTQIDVDADVVVVTDGSTYKQLAAINRTINCAGTGADGLDTGGLGANAWYYIYVIAKADGTQAGLASLSATIPAMPADYTFKKRVGAIRTDASAHFLKMFQNGAKSQYVNTGAGLPLLAIGIQGSTTTPTWVAVAVAPALPPTAIAIDLLLSGAAALIAAPNGSYGAYTDADNPPLLCARIGAQASYKGSFMLESTNIYVAGTEATSRWFCAGYTDNI